MTADPRDDGDVIGLVLARLDGVRPQSGYWMAQCPAHEDRQPSLSVKRGTSQPVILNCHAGCDPRDVIAAIGLDWSDICGERDQSAADHSPGFGRWFDRDIQDVYRYTDEQGTVLFEKMRFAEHPTKPKFLIRHSTSQGRYKGGMGGAKPVLWNLPAVLKAVRDGRTVYITEGEKDAKAVIAAGQTATCNFDGAAKEGQRTKVRPEYAEQLAGAHVVVVQDNDGPGRAHAQAWAKVLAGKAASVCVVGPAVGKDAYDHLVTGKRALNDLVTVGDGQDETQSPEPLPEIPRFPVDKLAGPLRSFVSWGTRDGLHPECTAAAGLAALVTLTGPATLKLGAKIIRAILWIALVGIASSGKSPAFEHAFAVLREKYAARRKQWDSDMTNWRGQVETEGRKNAGPPPARPEPFELDDATTESVARWLVARTGDTSGSIIDDELAAFLEGLNQYKHGQGSDVSRWLKFWFGAALHIQRVGDGGSRNAIDLYIPEPVVSIAGPLVPANLHLLGKPSSGFRPRWLPFYAPPVPPAWNHAGDYPDEWVKSVEALMEDREPREWRLAGQARTAWEYARRRWQAQQSEPEPDDVIEALRKADTQALRIALVIAESIDPGAGGDIPLDAVNCAVAIVDYCVDVWRALPGASTMTTSRREDVMDTAHRRLLAWLETRPKGTEGLPEDARPRSRASRREVQRWLHEPPNKINELINEHRQRWPGCVVTTETPGGGIPKIWIYAPLRTQISLVENDGVAATPSDSRVSLRGEQKTAGQAKAASPVDGVAGGVAPSMRHRSATPSPATSGGLRTVTCPSCGAAERTAVEPGETAYCKHCNAEYTAA